MAGVAEDEIIEHTLAQIAECYVFELPPRIRAEGWRRDGKLFAICQVEKGAVERVPDSSRYFVIKIKNAQGRHAFVGLAFNDRNEAFDFNVALQEFNKDLERDIILEQQHQKEESDSAGPTMDFSLKQGEKIKIAIGSKTSNRPKRSGIGTGKSGFALAPPPGDTATRKLGGAGGEGGLLAPPPGDSRRTRIKQPVPPSPKITTSPVASDEGASSNSAGDGSGVIEGEGKFTGAETVAKAGAGVEAGMEGLGGGDPAIGGGGLPCTNFPSSKPVDFLGFSSPTPGPSTTSVTTPTSYQEMDDLLGLSSVPTPNLMKQEDGLGEGTAGLGFGLSDLSSLGSSRGMGGGGGQGVPALWPAETAKEGAVAGTGETQVLPNTEQTWSDLSSTIPLSMDWNTTSMGLPAAEISQSTNSAPSVLGHASMPAVHQKPQQQPGTLLPPNWPEQGQQGMGGKGMRPSGASDDDPFGGLF